MSALIDSSSPDLSAFFGRGGKLILRENMGDLAQSPLAGIRQFAAVAQAVGTSSMENSARLTTGGRAILLQLQLRVHAFALKARGSCSDLRPARAFEFRR